MSCALPKVSSTIPAEWISQPISRNLMSVISSLEGVELGCSDAWKWLFFGVT